MMKRWICCAAVWLICAVLNSIPAVAHDLPLDRLMNSFVNIGPHQADHRDGHRPLRHKGLDATIVNVSLPRIQGSMLASQDQISCVLTSSLSPRAPLKACRRADPGHGRGRARTPPLQLYEAWG